MAKLSLNSKHQLRLNQAWTQMSEFQRVRDPNGKPNTVTLHFFDERDQAVGELLDLIIEHQNSDPLIFKINVDDVCMLEFVCAKVTSIKSPGFGAGEPKNLVLEVVVEYDQVKRTTITT